MKTPPTAIRQSENQFPFTFVTCNSCYTIKSTANETFTHCCFFLPSANFNVHADLDDYHRYVNRTWNIYARPAGKEEERAMFQQMQAMAQKQVNINSSNTFMFDFWLNIIDFMTKRLVSILLIRNWEWVLIIDSYKLFFIMTLFSTLFSIKWRTFIWEMFFYCKHKIAEQKNLTFLSKSR